MDGQGFDSDYNSRHTLFEYNYSHDNEGGFLLVCTPGDRDPAVNIGNHDIEVRYNISRNDRARTFHFAGPTSGTRVHHNAIYIGPGLEVQLLLLGDWKGWADDVRFSENEFIVAGTARYGHETARTKDGVYSIAAGTEPATRIVFDGNRYSGEHAGRPADAHAGVATPRRPLWNGPQFDPARGGNFNRFLAAHRAWMRRLREAQFGAAAVH
jgi:hypothetical protein